MWRKVQETSSLSVWPKREPCCLVVTNWHFMAMCRAKTMVSMGCVQHTMHVWRGKDRGGGGGGVVVRVAAIARSTSACGRDERCAGLMHCVSMPLPCMAYWLVSLAAFPTKLFLAVLHHMAPLLSSLYTPMHGMDALLIASLMT